MVAEVDPSRDELRYVNAGHNPALLISAAGGVEELHSGGLPLGLFDSGAYQAGRLDLEVGDLVCIYSDGITESTSPRDEEFGVERLVDLLREQREKPLAEIVRAVDAAVSDFEAGLNQGDDQTLVLLRRTA
jgi:sigma-B regulation protein RsbU (phosphoserine phosphatase)